MPSKPVNWECKWGPKDDAMLLVAINRYGYGNWESIRNDASLGFAERELPKGNDLKRRVDYLFKLLREEAGRITIHFFFPYI